MYAIGIKQGSEERPVDSAFVYHAGEPKGDRHPNLTDSALNAKIGGFRQAGHPSLSAFADNAGQLKAGLTRTAHSMRNARSVMVGCSANKGLQ